MAAGQCHTGLEAKSATVLRADWFVFPPSDSVPILILVLTTELIKHTTSLVSSFENSSEYQWTRGTSAYELGSSFDDQQQSHSYFSDPVASGANGTYSAADFADCQQTTGEPLRSSRSDSSLICFSMNFHANSIQVMTSPAQEVATATAGSSDRELEVGFAKSESDVQPYQYYYQHHHYQPNPKYTEPAAAGGGGPIPGGKSIRCYLSSSSTSTASASLSADCPNSL